jgi:hypothetical protein
MDVTRNSSVWIELQEFFGVAKALGRILVVNTWRHECESQQQKSNLILKHYSNKHSVTYAHD